MALKDLVSNLANFKYNQTSPDKVDSQIKEGVDFFNNAKGGAKGFTPKVEDLQSPTQYFKATSQFAATDNILESDGVFSPKYIKDIFPTVFTSDFMTTPIASYVSDYPREASLTWGNSPQKEMQNFAVGRSNTRVGLINDKRRGVFDHLTLTSFEHQPFPINQPNNMLDSTTVPNYSRYFSEMNGKSIHISDAGQLKAGVRYGASVGGVFTNFGNGNTLTDVKSAVGGGVTQFATLTPIADRTSQFSTNETPFEDGSYSEPFGFGNQQTTLFLKKEEWSKTNQIDNWRGTSAALTDVFSDGQSYGNIIWKDDTPTMPDLITLKKQYDDGESGTGTSINSNAFRTNNLNTFTNVPNGLSDTGFFGSSDYRTVANSGPFSGNNNHPLILRPMGSNWDNVLTDTPGLGGTIGSILEGALDGFGLLTRTSVGIADKIRIGTFLSTYKGVGFIAKQYALQSLNPTIESKIYNPNSLLGIPSSVDLTGIGIPLENGFISAVVGKALSFVLPTHVERHFGGARYENVINVIPYDADLDSSSRLAFQVKAFTVPGPPPKVKTGNEFLDNVANAAVNFVSNLVDKAAAQINIGFSNPNKYAPWPSAAPISVHNGNVAFGVGTFTLFSDVDKVMNKKGGTFNEKSSISEKAAPDLTMRHSTLSYEKLIPGFGYTKFDSDQPTSPQEINSNSGPLPFSRLGDDRRKFKKITDGIGNVPPFDVQKRLDKGLGIVKGDLKSSHVDKINALQYGLDYTTNPVDSLKDFIKFRFRDVVNNKFIIFRAILDGITDSVTPEYGEEKYIGRPDKVYVYQGAERNISFNFSLYPKTKQEFPVMLNKLNYLVGMCYPTYTEQELMITPFMELTLGDMFLDTPGLLFGVGVTVEDDSTWELDEGLQFPHYIKVACEFKHIGNRKLSSTGIHYDLKVGRKTTGAPTAAQQAIAAIPGQPVGEFRRASYPPYAVVEPVTVPKL